MNKVFIVVEVEQIKKMIEQLRQKEQMRTVQDLVAIQMDSVVKNIRNGGKKKGLSQRYIYKIAEEVRQKRYDRGNRRPESSSSSLFFDCMILFAQSFIQNACQ